MNYYTISCRPHYSTVLQCLCCGDTQMNAHNCPFSLNVFEGKRSAHEQGQGLGRSHGGLVACSLYWGRGKAQLPPPVLQGWCALLGEITNKSLWCGIYLHPLSYLTVVSAQGQQLWSMPGSSGKQASSLLSGWEIEAQEGFWGLMQRPWNWLQKLCLNPKC